MSVDDIAGILNEEDITGIARSISENKQYAKIQRKLDRLTEVLDRLGDKFDAGINEAVKKFVDKKDDDYFLKIISKRGGYITPGFFGITKLDPLLFIRSWEKYESFSYSGYCYWTDVECWATFRGKENLLKKMTKPATRVNNLEAKQSDLVMKLTKEHLKRNHNDEELKSIMTEIKRILKKNKKEYSRMQSPWRKALREVEKSVRTRRELNEISGGTWETLRIGSLLKKEFEKINEEGFIAILNSEGEVVRYINAEAVKKSLIDSTYEAHEEKLQESAKHFSEYRKIYFQKHADSKID